MRNEARLARRRRSLASLLLLSTLAPACAEVPEEAAEAVEAERHLRDRVFSF